MANNGKKTKIDPFLGEENDKGILFLPDNLKHYLWFDSPVKFAWSGVLAVYREIQIIRPDWTDRKCGEWIINSLKKQCKEDTKAIWGVMHPDASMFN